MDNKLRFDFDVNQSDGSVTVVREFAAPLQRVWEAWTTADLLDQWWAPKPYVAKTKEFSFTPGGRWLYAMVGPQGDEQWCRAIFTAIDAASSYSYDDAFSDAEGNVTNEFPGSHWDLSFRENSGTTTVTIHITHKSAADLEQIMKMGFKEGFSMGLGNLDEVLAKNK